jgi:hypothetical protein
MLNHRKVLIILVYFGWVLPLYSRERNIKHKAQKLNNVPETTKHFSIPSIVDYKANQLLRLE